jgi:hypothetical protein
VFCAHTQHTADRQNVVINTIFFVLGPRFCGLFTLGFVGYIGVYLESSNKGPYCIRLCFCLSVVGVVAEKKGVEIFVFWYV